MPRRRTVCGSPARRRTSPARLSRARVPPHPCLRQREHPSRSPAPPPQSCAAAGCRGARLSWSSSRRIHGAEDGDARGGADGAAARWIQAEIPGRAELRRRPISPSPAAAEEKAGVRVHGGTTRRAASAASRPARRAPTRGGPCCGWYPCAWAGRRGGASGVARRGVGGPVPLSRSTCRRRARSRASQATA
jgi:hypothetical protein